jgi:hypothetical protein
MTDKERSRILNLFAEYEGTIYESENRITIEADNLISNTIRTKLNKCTVRIVYYDRRELFNWSVEAEERGLEILGGCGLPCDDLDEALRKAERQLEKYNFKRVEQISLF